MINLWPNKQTVSKLSQDYYCTIPCLYNATSVLQSQSVKCTNSNRTSTHAVHVQSQITDGNSSVKKYKAKDFKTQGKNKN